MNFFAGLQLGPILEYAITECLLDQMYVWCEKSEEYKEQIAICQVYFPSKNWWLEYFNS